MPARRKIHRKSPRVRKASLTNSHRDLVLALKHLASSIDRFAAVIRPSDPTYQLAALTSIAPLTALELAEHLFEAVGPKDLFPFGVWESNEGHQRWHLDFNDNGCVWAERAPSGATFQRTVPLQRTGSGWIVQRVNDAEVLRFLGASAAATSEILARNPQPSFIRIDVLPDRLQGEWNGLRWTSNPAGHLQTLEQPGSTPATIKIYTFTRHGDDSQWFKVARGQLTFAQEGQEGTLYHSRWLQWPGGKSGVTLGRGYDMGSRTVSAVQGDLVSVGVSPSLASAFAGGAGKSGAAAQTFVSENRASLGNISPGQQLRLFQQTYQEMEDDSRRICQDPQVVSKYGSVDFNILDLRIWAVIVDLRYRGDYSPAARTIMQQPAAANDIAAFRQAMGNRAYWASVPQARFDARVAALA